MLQVSWRGQSPETSMRISCLFVAALLTACNSEQVSQETPDTFSFLKCTTLELESTEELQLVIGQDRIFSIEGDGDVVDWCEAREVDYYQGFCFFGEAQVRQETKSTDGITVMSFTLNRFSLRATQYSWTDSDIVEWQCVVEDVRAFEPQV